MAKRRDRVADTIPDKNFPLVIIRLHRHILYYTAVEYNSLFIQLPTVYDDIRLQFDYLLKSKAMISLFQRKILERFCYIKKC